MEALKIKGTYSSPTVVLDADNEIFEISGRSLPDDVATFYAPILKWLDEYSKNPNEETVFSFKLVYFNTATSKLLLNIMMKLKNMQENDHDILVKWYYEEDDEDMIEAGEEYADVAEIDVELVMYE